MQSRARLWPALHTTSATAASVAFTPETDVGLLERAVTQAAQRERRMALLTSEPKCRVPAIPRLAS